MSAAMPQRAFAGAVLAGGASTRMGRDKALVPVAGRPLALVAASALRGAGASRVVAIGGQPALEGHGLPVIGDLHPGEGPLGGVITALRSLDAAIVAVLTCDLPSVTPHEVACLVASLDAEPRAAVAVAVQEGGRRQYLTAAYRVDAALGPLGAAFTAGERAVRRAAADLATVEVDGLDPHRLADVDTPAELARLQRVRSGA